VKKLKTKVRKAYNRRKLGGNETTIKAVALGQNKAQETF
jgi:hypothetical protein